MKLYVFPPSPNSRKVLTANNFLGLDLPVNIVDLQAGDQFHEAFAELNPNAKVPVLEEDDGSSLWESNAIVNRLCTDQDTPLWPRSNQRYDIMRWQFWEGCHWTPACSKFISRHFFGREDIDMAAAEEDFHKCAKVLDGHLDGRNWLSGEAMTTADVSVAAILCYRESCQYPVESYGNILRWIARIEALEAWKTANPTPQAAE